MDTLRSILRSLLAGFFLVLIATRASAIIFTSNQSIGPLDTAYDGADIVISNCTVTMDGAHSFNSLLVTNGGVLTHSFWPDGRMVIPFTVTNEPHVLSGTNPVTLLNTNVSLATPLVVTDAGQTTTYTNGVDYVEMTLGTDYDHVVMQIARTNNTSSIPDGATVLVSYTWNYIAPAGLDLTVTGDVAVANGGTINASGAGYGAPFNPSYGYPGFGSSSGGTFFDGSGAGHGGNGGKSSSNAAGGACYDSLYQPTDLGSGGGASYAGSGGNGGGRIQIVAGGTVRVDGLIAANGADATNSRAGGGAGGSIWITATNLTGVGNFSANGGAGEPVHGGGGGGGRISLQCGTNQFSGNLTAYGGNGWQIGGAGTIFTQTNGQAGLLLVDNDGHVGANSTVTLATAVDVVIRGGAGLKISGAFNPINLTIATNSVLTGSAQTVYNLTVAGNLTVQSGGAVMFDSLGYAPGTGTAPGSYFSSGTPYPCGGGGHGGYGAAGSYTNASGGITYGSQSAPITLGSGGGNYSASIGGAGGGALQLNVSGSLQLDGRISANGGDGSGTGGGGGAGGSVYISCGPFTGSGSISANGGTGVSLIGGGGGGGRIAVIAGASSFTGQLNAFGGGGANYGGAGTVFLQTGATQQFILDNAGHSGTNTSLASASAANLIIQNGAKGVASSIVNFSSLLVGSNAWLVSPGSQYAGGTYTITGNATFQAGGGFMADSGGYSGTQGSGHGGYSTYAPYGGGGGGHGCDGGNAISNSAVGGISNDYYLYAPVPFYLAGAGGGYAPYSFGGNGGGYIRMTVGDTLQLDGSISANGGNGSGAGGGGGAGGSVYLTTGTFAGNGTIIANGGAGANANGGGGGGGMVAIYFNSNSFTGTITAFGGSGANYGGAGTIYLRTNFADRAQLIVDNGGHAGAKSTTFVSLPVDLTLRGGGISYLSSPVAYGNLLIGSNAWLMASNGSPSGATITASNVIVQAGGGIIADAAGFAQNVGAGRGITYGVSPWYQCSGAGYGGYGANSFSNAAAGGNAVLDSISAPNQAGSGGGGYSTYSFGGNGGGFIQMNVIGKLQVDGILSANGANGYGIGGGGGAGGGLNLSCQTLTGSGTIAANGGNGVDGIGGGGGGGRIAVACTSNLFAGTLSAYGGGGAYSGGAGTVYMQNNTSQQLILDNAGRDGTNTALLSASAADLTVQNGAKASAGSSVTFKSLVVTSNAWLTQFNSSLTILGNATIQTGGGFTADAANASGSSANGGASSTFPYGGGGGGHGGGSVGGNAISNSATGGSAGNDSISSPSGNYIGKGGGNSPYSTGGSGGGFVQMTVNGTLQLDGRISANGGSGSGLGGGGGGGGSVRLTTGVFTGDGVISANGGDGVNGVGGGGGGGMIAVYFNNDSFNGTITAFGGNGANYGGAGTIYLKTNSANYAQLLVDNAGHAGPFTAVLTSGTDLSLQNGGAGIISASSAAFGNLLVGSNAWLLVSNTVSSPTSTSITANNVTVQTGGNINANASGYTANNGSGHGTGLGTSPWYPGSGGGYGGYGAGSISNLVAGGSAGYGSATSPNAAGSGGGGYAQNSIGGNGGGLIQLSVSDTLQVDGNLSANGGNGAGFGGGGGSGGGLNLNVANLRGSGVIAVNGGFGVNNIGGGGGGGLAAIYFNSNSFTGTLSALGGGGANWGGAGTVYLKTNSASIGRLIVDNGGHVGASSSIPSSPSTDVTLLNGGGGRVSGAVTLKNLLISSNAWLVVSNGSPSSATITAGSVTIQAGGSLNADSSGYTANNGTGHGNIYYGTPPLGSGGGNGGYGANAAQNSAGGGTAGYNSITSPNTAGSGGGGNGSSIGGNGGGLIQLNIAGTLQVDGFLSANGGSGSGPGGGGGSGGSLNVSVGGLLGSGGIAANGGLGAGSNGGGGGGGVIAITFTTNFFTGTISAYGGGGTNYGGAGTILMTTNLSGPPVLIVDNGGHRGTNTYISSINGCGLAVQNGGVAGILSQSYSSLLIGSNGWLVSANYPGTLNLTVTGDAAIQSGAGIVTDGAGSTQNNGPGHGYAGMFYSPLYPCSGAGHGGFGGDDLLFSSQVGNAYDSTTTPATIGSGGGGNSTYSLGGSGGGYVNLHVNGALLLNGIITANGNAGSGLGGGGGSGGAINLNLGTFAGTGSIAANGGGGANAIGGGGGGGRIAIYFDTNSFAGSVSAYGGNGGFFGGAGTVYFKTNSQTRGLVLVDNNANLGEATTFDLLSENMIIQNGGFGFLPASFSWSPYDLIIHTNGTLSAQYYSGTRAISAHNIAIDAGGALTVDHEGYISQSGSTGPGAGYGGPNLGGGGGHGGYGGGNWPFGGGAYDSIQSPTSAGSSGGTKSGALYSYRGRGGGALLLNAATLTVNGRLSANGDDGYENTGGGAGGSLYLQSINNLAGSGVIAANGGAATGATGGSGGGGRIAIYCVSNNFTGQISAAGGNGNYPGGAGTIFTRINNGIPTLLVDNGGINGTNTPLSSSFALPAPPFDLNITGAADVVPLTPLPLISNLNLAAGSKLTMPIAQSSLIFAVQNDANLAGSVTVDNLGFTRTNGPGAGSALGNQGSGGGYGGAGGDSASGAPGGITYGSATQPVDFGSGGGTATNSGTGGSEGGGAIRIIVGGTLNLDGSVSANGDYGWQDDSGGGAGGSIWITAGTLTGSGALSAAGGDGDPWNGGGGGGGRIAIYAPANLFAGTTNVTGGFGAWDGQAGTVFVSGSLLDFQILSQSPSGTVSNAVSYVDLEFNGAVDPASVSAGDFTVTTPAGVLDSSDVSATITDAATVRVGFPVQNLLGDYTIQAATTITNLFGLPLSSPYLGGFTIAPLTIRGTVTDTNGAPVAGVTLQPDGGLAGTLTDGAGNYAIGVPPGWNGTVTPSFSSFMFIPGSLAFTNVTSSLTNQNFLMVATIAPAIVSSLNGTNLALAWTGYSGVNYQTWSSTNLVDWLPYGDVIPGTNGPMHFGGIL